MTVSTRTNEYRFISPVKNLILLIEDDIDHAELTMRILEEQSIPNQMLHFQDGQSALDFLFGRNPVDSLVSDPRPQLILLDVHLPGSNGIEILKAIKESDELKTIPVVMLTTSDTEAEMMRAYENHANSYIVKPVGYEEFKLLIAVLCQYWLGSNRRPQIQVRNSQIQSTAQ